MRTSPLESNCRQASFQYDFTRHGGAVGAITVPGDNIPADAIILDGIIRVNTAVTSSGLATVAIMAQGAADILAATAKASLTLNALLNTVPVGTAATAIRLTAAITGLTFTVGTEALTAGKITVSLRWMRGQ
jgi:hypothetical protein